MPPLRLASCPSSAWTRSVHLLFDRLRLRFVAPALTPAARRAARFGASPRASSSVAPRSAAVHSPMEPKKGMKAPPGGIMDTVALLFIGCLVVVGQCRPEPENTLEDGHANMTMVVSSLTENKLALKFCVDRDCKDSSHEPYITACQCCLALEGLPCFHSRKECLKHCPNSPPTPANKGVHY
ncbi:hypothetical protein ZWY2020_044849 [Hordeum vulgare]|nr:hypothetical protein ZWY2020_044849 [Hordeum vulgare]